MWTVEKVKAELPDVKVIDPSGLVSTAKVTGRLMPQATVSIVCDDGTHINFQFAWTTIVNCLNNGRDLKI